MYVCRVWPAVLLLLLGGCHRVQAPASIIQMGDRAVASQLISGFYDIEGGGSNRWRWTGPDFSLALASPPAPQHGARLVLRLYFPETQIQKLGPMTLTAFVDGQPLAPETYAKSGDYDFVRDVPACFLDTNVLPIAFSLDPYSPKSAGEGRDLGAVVLMAALEPEPGKQ
jgi:hypothetical protein